MEEGTKMSTILEYPVILPCAVLDLHGQIRKLGKCCEFLICNVTLHTCLSCGNNGDISLG